MSVEQVLHITRSFHGHLALQHGSIQLKVLIISLSCTVCVTSNLNEVFYSTSSALYRDQSENVLTST